MFLTVLSLAGTFVTLVGLLVLVLIFVVPNRPPMDTSNRIAHLRLVWNALRHPEDFVELIDPDTGKAQFEYLTKDDRD